jgi:hypothetical protein
MGLFDWPAPLFSAFDDLIAHLSGPLGRVIIWAVLCAAVSMAFYTLLSPQNRIRLIKEHLADARTAMAEDDGEDFGRGMALARRQLAESFKLVGVILLPAVIASLPGLALIIWLDGQYGYRCPTADQPVTISAQPENSPVSQIGAVPTGPDGGACPIVQVPTTNTQRDDATAPSAPETMAVALAAPVPVLAHHQWWNSLIGNPAGYLPDQTPIEQLRFDLPAQQILSVGPGWARGWELTFFVVLVLASIGIKKGFRIE